LRHMVRLSWKMKVAFVLIGSSAALSLLHLISIMESTCTDFSTLEQALAVEQDWEKSDYAAASEFIQSYRCDLDPKNSRLHDLKGLLLEKRDFVQGLLQNPNLFEHDRFTDLLWSVRHLTEELEARKNRKDDLAVSFEFRVYYRGQCF
jgi:hypothetical protein